MFRIGAAVLCALWCLIACVVVGVRVQQPNAFDVDIQNLLPRTALEPVIRSAVADAGATASQRVAVLVSAEDPIRAQDAAVDLERRFVAAGFAPDHAQGEAVGRWMFANRNQLSCALDPAEFDADATLRRSQVLLYSPLAPVSGGMLEKDPFLLTLQLAECLSPPSGGQVGDAVLVSGMLTGSAYRIDVQDTMAKAFAGWRAQWPDVTASRAGAVFFAEAAARQTRGEMTLIGGISALFILALLLACFRRPHAILGTFAVTAAGAVGSLAAAFLLFPSVHVMVFVFGSALIGVTSDYALHYLATGPQTGWASRRERLKIIRRPLAVCALSTSLGFAGLGLFGVEVFNQVAVFSVAGILTAWWFTMTLLPLLDPRAKQAGKLTAWWNRLESPFLAFRWRPAWSVIGLLLVAGAVVAGTARFAVLDDVRQFQPRSAALSAEEARVRQAVGFSASPQFLLSWGDDAQEARQREETRLAGWPETAGRDVLAVSRFDPSDARRAANEAILRRALFEPHLAQRARDLGLGAADPFAAVTPAPALPPLIADLEGTAGGLHYLVAPLGAVAAAGPDADRDGSRIIDPTARYTEAFATFRGLAAAAVLATFAACALLVLLLYRTWRALLILAAPTVGVVMAVALPTALGMPVSFFSVAALFVVIGVGIDHSVFLFEAKETRGTPKELVVFLAGLTTILSMGLLGLSGTFPVASFGIAVAVGVTAAYLCSFAPFNVWGKSGHANQQD
ncbi:MMPL family transporter [Brevundimonas sp. FT23042]|uniref:MMPL family transporter n=1 Tax=Brevundimonas sp. FT23042 TaxID=3393749 RepID=UPI003B587BF1